MKQFLVGCAHLVILGAALLANGSSLAATQPSTPPVANPQITETLNLVLDRLGHPEVDEPTPVYGMIRTILEDLDLAEASTRSAANGSHDPASNPVAAARKDLLEVISNIDATDAQVLEKLKVLRECRAKAEAKLKADREVLRKRVSMQQEVFLVALGILE